MAAPGAARSRIEKAVRRMERDRHRSTGRAREGVHLLQRGRLRPQIRTKGRPGAPIQRNARLHRIALALGGVVVLVALLAATPHFSLATKSPLAAEGPLAGKVALDPSVLVGLQRSAQGRTQGSDRFAGTGRPRSSAAASPRPASDDPTVLARYAMVDQMRRRGLRDARVLDAMAAVPRHLFVPEVLREEAHADKALPIGHGQNIYQPYLVGYMTSLLDLQPGDRVLEIGTGSGYHTAVLAHLAAQVYSIEIIEELGHRAAEVLSGLGYDNIHLSIGDGYQGWADAAPFDAILLTAAPPEIPQALIGQLAEGGTMVAPVGGGPVQELQVIVKTQQGLERQYKGPYIVPPMTRNGGEASRDPSRDSGGTDGVESP